MNRLQNSNLPFINLSKENLFLVCDMLELDEIGLLIVAIKEYLYEGKEPNLNTKPLRSAWSQVLMLIDRKADSYFTRKEQMEKINKSKKDKKAELTQASTSSIKDVKPEEFELPNCQIPNTADLSPSNDEEVEQSQPTVDNTTEAIKTAIEEEVQINNNIDNDMGTFIGDFKELNSKTTPKVEKEFDNFSDTLNDLLDEYEGVIEQLTDMLAKANISDDVYIISTAKMAEMRIKNIAKELITEIDKTNYTNYINEKIEIKTKRLQVA